MVVEQTKLALILLCSVALGLFWGIVYGIFKFTRLCFPLRRIRVNKQKKSISIEDVVVFFEDVLFSLLIAVFTCIFIYYMNAGRFRGIVIIGAVLGFAVYHCTVGKLVLRLYAFIVRVVVLGFKQTFKYAILPIFRVFMFVFNMTIGRVFAKIYTDFQKSVNIILADKGFGIITGKG
ncbi:MAG: spore cortex biosynthesis protein YabQ [Clostridia bacterium]|nr:spore cortex biosynthesis protein YabQ [Clostridia bacterium]